MPEVTCRSCHGSGVNGSGPCKTCGGSGIVWIDGGSGR